MGPLTSVVPIRSKRSSPFSRAQVEVVHGLGLVVLVGVHQVEGLRRLDGCKYCINREGRSEVAGKQDHIAHGN